uniref:Uncharacterized protein n=1 Tax=Panagrolaimus sp. JU765 TaxID=591449 RepID=A0AC34Q6C1_9BILA
MNREMGEIASNMTEIMNSFLLAKTTMGSDPGRRKTDSGDKNKKSHPKRRRTGSRDQSPSQEDSNSRTRDPVHRKKKVKEINSSDDKRKRSKEVESSDNRTPEKTDKAKSTFKNVEEPSDDRSRESKKKKKHGKKEEGGAEIIHLSPQKRENAKKPSMEIIEAQDVEINEFLKSKHESPAKKQQQELAINAPKMEMADFISSLPAEARERPKMYIMVRQNKTTVRLGLPFWPHPPDKYDDARNVVGFTHHEMIEMLEISKAKDLYLGIRSRKQVMKTIKPMSVAFHLCAPSTKMLDTVMNWPLPLFGVYKAADNSCRNYPVILVKMDDNRVFFKLHGSDPDMKTGIFITLDGLFRYHQNEAFLGAKKAEQVKIVKSSYDDA